MNSEALFNCVFWLRLDDVSVQDVNKLTTQPFEMELEGMQPSHTEV